MLEKRIGINEKSETPEMLTLLKSLSETEKERMRYVIQGLCLKDEVVAGTKSVGA